MRKIGRMMKGWIRDKANFSNCHTVFHIEKKMCDFFQRQLCTTYGVADDANVSTVNPPSRGEATFSPELNDNEWVIKPWGEDGEWWSATKQNTK